jgi:hypothetical protein
MCLVRVSEETAIISLYRTNWLVFIIEIVCVYCSVRADFLNVLHANFSFMTLAWLSSQMPACHRGGRVSVHAKFAVDKMELRIIFLRLFRFPLPISFQQCSTLIFMYLLLLPERKTGETWEPSKKQFYFGNRGEMGSNVLSLFLYIIKIMPS